MADDEETNSALSKHGYTCIKLIGEGSSSQVFLCKSDKYDNFFAVKKVSIDSQKVSEYNALTLLDHPYIIKLYKSFKEHDSEYLVMEYCSNETLKQKKKLDYKQFVNYSKQILEALSYCHSKKIAHRDIKPDNIFIDEYDHIKLADFGLSKSFEPNVKSNESCGSLMYSSPEMLKKIPFDPFKADIWALGITFFYMAAGKYPFSAKSYDQLFQLVKFGQVNFFNVEINLSIKALIQKMTSKDPKNRPSINEILNMPIFNKQKEPRLTKILSMGQICSKGKKSREKSCYIKPSLSFSDDQNDQHMNESNISLSQSHAYKSSIAHSCFFKNNVIYESLLIQKDAKE